MDLKWGFSYSNLLKNAFSDAYSIKKMAGIELYVLWYISLRYIDKNAGKFFYIPKHKKVNVFP